MIDFSAEWNKIQYFKKLRTEYRQIDSKFYVRSIEKKERKRFIEEIFKKNKFKL